jgi:hypothetical protein
LAFLRLSIRDLKDDDFVNDWPSLVHSGRRKNQRDLP